MHIILNQFHLICMEYVHTRGKSIWEQQEKREILNTPSPTPPLPLPPNKLNIIQRFLELFFLIIITGGGATGTHTTDLETCRYDGDADLNSCKVTLQAVTNQNGFLCKQAEEHCLHIPEVGGYPFHILCCYSTKPEGNNMHINVLSVLNKEF